VTISAQDAAYALVVAGAAMIWPPLALIVAAAFLIVALIVNDRRAEPASVPGQDGRSG
jgi:hypothetical protein